jgi:hypothetical protein
MSTVSNGAGRAVEASTALHDLGDQMNKQKVLLAVLCGLERTNWINPNLSVNLWQMAHDARFETYYAPVTDQRPFEFARNGALQAAQRMGVDWLLSIDNDNFIQSNPLDLIAAANTQQNVIGVASAIGAATQNYKLFPEQRSCVTDGPFVEVPAVGGAVLCVHKSVWQKIPRGPWFKYVAADDELCTPLHGEDVFFCRLVREHGMRVWTHSTLLAGHYRTTDITRLAVQR